MRNRLIPCFLFIISIYLEPSSMFITNEEMLNKIYGELTVISIQGKNQYNQTLFNCICSCGRQKIVNKYSLTREIKGTKSCGHLKSSNRILKNLRFPRDEFRKAAIELKLDNNSLILNRARKSRHSATDRNIPWSLTAKQAILLCSNSCFYCDFDKKGKIGIDRIDSNQGYTQTNTVSCCSTCNKAKNNMNIEHFVQWLKNITKSTWYNKQVTVNKT